MSAFQKETVLSVKHWTDSLFSFTATRDPGFRFQNGQFAMIGLEVEGRPSTSRPIMANCPFWNRKPELRVAVKLKSVSVQCRTERTFSL